MTLIFGLFLWLTALSFTFAIDSERDGPETTFQTNHEGTVEGKGDRFALVEGSSIHTSNDTVDEDDMCLAAGDCKAFEGSERYPDALIKVHEMATRLQNEVCTLRKRLHSISWENEILEAESQIALESNEEEFRSLCVRFPKESSTTLGGAAVIGGIIGLFVGGPGIAIISGLGFAYATTTEGLLGDVARAIGELALHGSMKAAEINRKHNVVESMRTTVRRAWWALQESNQRRGITRKLRELPRVMWRKTLRYEQEHRVVESTVSGAARAANAIGKSLLSDEDAKDSGFSHKILN